MEAKMDATNNNENITLNNACAVNVEVLPSEVRFTPCVA